jgi:hypothetical protein
MMTDCVVEKHRQSQFLWKKRTEKIDSCLMRMWSEQCLTGTILKFFDLSFLPPAKKISTPRPQKCSEPRWHFFTGFYCFEAHFKCITQKEHDHRLYR